MTASSNADQTPGQMRLIPGVHFKHPAKKAVQAAQTTPAPAIETTHPAKSKPQAGANPAAKPHKTAGPAPAQLTGLSIGPKTVTLSAKHHRLTLLVGLGFTMGEVKRIMKLWNKNQVARIRRECTRGLPYQTVPCAIVHRLAPEAIAAAADGSNTEVAERAKTVIAAVETVTTGRFVFTPDDLVNLSDFTAHYLSYQSGRPGSECGPLSDIMFQLGLAWPVHVVTAATCAGVLTPEVLIANAPAEPQLFPHA